MDGFRLTKLPFVLQAGQAIHCTQPKYLCNQLPQYNLELFSLVMILLTDRALAKIDKLGRLEQLLLLPPLHYLYTLQLSFPTQHKSVT